ncbi:formate dehydrogenase accessory sulfurtransferase FdhD [Staphylococcus simiae]|uniref:formate dehydrogenase accessory sulfurtransferase FdhD n=1 Tax=Staphylococcus simiae TaxID=308354 RepID=UPI001A9595B7|nr:formate dehydrogenase accessory sulfurtransferase FdhD [Staphylococcus simiae]MBO1198114.1 formate dehydrogenase accessory sulfurtransferase FdhD [Staphylococcus simiae]MBO1200136.1 formate dehydrogenase accessory sulfurtransferase FdhD [Staphylococcus simiae]MBO1202409.1 formate dehydrogenase accessory sulfurtransferase FdhD [Staphylococcus simiae]MBO1210021.1 formate dehydrogenase accessory sulfurtransferase FdhD [Staphylococcus simiae]MBO1228553.1 formate dehydrogenase accessory sulfurtr
MNEDVSTGQPIVRYENGELYETTDQYVTEFPLTIMVNGEEFATVICSPTNLEELVIGFLASEGAILKRDELKSVMIDDSKGFAHVELTKALGDRFEYSTKRMIASCCGKSREFYFQNDAAVAKTSMSKIKLNPTQIFNMMTRLRTASQLYQQTGGLHNAAISDGDNFFEHRQDIGRHNALDKLYGFCIQRHIPVRDKVLIFSGRISSEILIKAAKIGVGVILSKSAPTTLAVTLADDLNITAVGFIRNGGFNIYSHPERIVEDEDVIEQNDVSLTNFKFKS